MAGRMARPMGWGKPGGAPGGKSAAGPMPMCPMMGMMCPMGRGHRPGK